jgi:hypothetical protein
MLETAPKFETPLLDNGFESSGSRIELNFISEITFPHESDRSIRPESAVRATGPQKETSSAEGCIRFDRFFSDPTIDKLLFG